MTGYGRPDRRDWVLGEDAAEPIVRQAVESGMTFFDTADTYSDGISAAPGARIERMVRGRPGRWYAISPRGDM